MTPEFYKTLRWTMAKWNIKQNQIARMGDFSLGFVGHVCKSERPVNAEFLYAVVKTMESQGADSFELRQIAYLGVKEIVTHQGFDSFVKIDNEKAWDWVMKKGAAHRLKKHNQKRKSKNESEEAVERIKRSFE